MTEDRSLWPSYLAAAFFIALCAGGFYFAHQDAEDYSKGLDTMPTGEQETQ